MMDATEAREKIAGVLHAPRPEGGYDNTVLWAGSLSLHINGETFNPLMSRIFIDTSAEGYAEIKISAEFYFKGVTDHALLPPGALDARLWLDINDRGETSVGGNHVPPPLRYEKMHPVRHGNGIPERKDGSVLFVSDKIKVYNTGVFNYTVSFSADGLDDGNLMKEWIAINDISHNRDGLIVVSDTCIMHCPSISEICIRKYGSSFSGGKFVSGKISDLTKDLHNVTTEVVYILPFFLTGTMDAATGKDVRKGELGSIYATKDFFRIAPELAPESSAAALRNYASRGLIRDVDLEDLLPADRLAVISTAGALASAGDETIAAAITAENATEIAARAAMRELCDRAHSLGKRVIFDLVVMQTSRDSKLIDEHLDWYSLDEDGLPRKHSIAWLNYSDVALFNLSFNEPLQDYIGGVAPYWINRCGFDGVRIDASQTVDRPFLKKLKNMINEVKPDAIVLGETLCPMEQAMDVPADMIYTLLVDHHVNADRAGAFFDVFEQTHGTYEKGTVAIAYFENHDSVRATLEWHRKFYSAFEADPALNAYWETQARGAINFEDTPSPWDVAYFPALLKNIMSSLINCTAGTRDAVMFSYAIEAGTDYGEEARTDFEHTTRLYLENRDKKPHSLLHYAYTRLEKLKIDFPLLHQGKVYYFRNNSPGCDESDKLMAYCKHDGAGAMFVACNLDWAVARRGFYPLGFLDIDPDAIYEFFVVFDSFSQMKASRGSLVPDRMHGRVLLEAGLPFLIPPLCSAVIEMKRCR